MIKLNNLPKTAAQPKKRLGQGHGSGKGKTGGRGTKGQNARENVSLTFSSGPMSFVRRLPLIRGKYRNKPITKKPLIINLKYLNVLVPNTVVDVACLIKSKIIKEWEIGKYGVKILGEGEIRVPLIVKLACSKRAAKKIEAVGGKVEKVS